MRGAHDIGGMHGLGPVVPEPEDAPLFHEAWERRMFGLSQAAGAAGLWGLDMSRAQTERQHPADYLTKSYFELWVDRLEVMATRHGMITAQELATGIPMIPPCPVRGKIRPEDVAAVHGTRFPTLRAHSVPPAFAVGDPVRVLRRHSPRHTRQPSYLNGCLGRILTWHGAHVFPDTNAYGEGENPQHLYTVEFEGSAVWGTDAEPGSLICADLWQPYIGPAEVERDR